MNEETIKTKVRAAFVKVLEHEDFVLNNDTSANDVKGWESITHMMIINEIEQEFNIKFKLMDLMNMNNIGDLLQAIKTTMN
ncbi:acyl carrier protein [Algibacter pectinivorans]|uniref:Acyl carrier protein n=1 Tax=Algibacter pectinivorans TaxID=870482 RepID=A0A1I1PCA5_9FLAO|nr:acyl carrier protein [Algibacter pectinivorans]SFD07477.1 acyl carrier protein [Algibacter pectinivorans]